MSEIEGTKTMSSDEARAEAERQITEYAYDYYAEQNRGSFVAGASWQAGRDAERIAALEAEVEEWRRVAVEQTRLERDRAEATEAKLAEVRGYIAAVQNSPGLTETGHHARWLREALTVIDGVDTGTGST